MKVLQINCVYRRGSTGKLVYALHTAAEAAGFSSTVCYGRGQAVAEPHVFKTCGELAAKANNLRSRVTGLPYGGCGVATARLLRRITLEKPDVVHLHSVNGFFVNLYRLLAWLKEQGIPTVLTLHAEFPYTANCAHAMDCMRWKTGCGCCPRRREATNAWLFDRTHSSWQRMAAAFAGFERLTVVSVSPWLEARARQSPMLADKRHVLIPNGVNRLIFRPREELRGEFFGKKVVLHVTAGFSEDPSHAKGGWYLLQLAERMPDVLFLVAGRCVGRISAPANVVLLGSIEDQVQLAAYYARADATVLTAKRETFSMPVAESLCCGTPVVGFRAGAPEEIALPRYSSFVDFGDLDALQRALNAWLAEPKPAMLAEAASCYDEKRMVEAYLKLYQEVAQYEEGKA